jgi:hypothetical protein
MKWISALLLGALLGFTGPMSLGGRDGLWMHSWAKSGTIAPFDSSPGLLFSIPLAIGAAIVFRLFFNWHRN